MQFISKKLTTPQRVAAQLLVVALGLAIASPWIGQSPAQPPAVKVKAVKGSDDFDYTQPDSKREALARARLLHELSAGALQVVHRDFFDDENPKSIPSASLERVFTEVSRTYGVTMKWLNVGLDVVNVDHQPENDFEVLAAQKISKGDPFVEQLESGKYTFVGSIRLGSQCLKCHLKDRRSTEAKAAGLVISMQLSDQARED